MVFTADLNEYERREVRVCELKGKQYVVFTTVKKIKGEWKPIGGYSVPKQLFGAIYDGVNELDLKNAFGAKDAKDALKVVNEIEPNKEAAKIKVGSRVEHKTYGIGTVKGEYNHAQCKVQFDLFKREDNEDHLQICDYRTLTIVPKSSKSKKEGAK